jgi:hypothetical protein
MENLLTTENLHRLIQERAYEIYLSRGRAEGHQHEDWDQAENEIIASLVNVNPVEVSLPERENTALNLPKLKRAKGARA